MNAKIDPNADYDAMLAEAQERAARFRKIANDLKYDPSPSALAERGRARDEYEAWVRKTFADRGLTLVNDALTGVPVKISATLAERKARR